MHRWDLMGWTINPTYNIQSHCLSHWVFCSNMMVIGQKYECDGVATTPYNTKHHIINLSINLLFRYRTWCGKINDLWILLLDSNQQASLAPTMINSEFYIEISHILIFNTLENCPDVSGNKALKSIFYHSLFWVRVLHYGCMTMAVQRIMLNRILSLFAITLLSCQVVGEPMEFCGYDFGGVHYGQLHMGMFYWSKEIFSRKTLPFWWSNK